MACNSRGNVIKAAMITTATTALFFASSLVCQAAAAPTGQTTITNILWRGVAPDQGYGQFEWGDSPTQSADVVCSPVKEVNSVMPNRECTSTTNMPYAGGFQTKYIKYIFKYEQLVKVEIKYSMPTNNNEIPDYLPKSISMLVGGIYTTFSHDATSEEALLTIENVDLLVRILSSKLVSKKVASSENTTTAGQANVSDNGNNDTTTKEN